MSTIKVFRLDDIDWWAGESLAACIEAARLQCGADSYPDAEIEGRELDAAQMELLKIHQFEDSRAAPVSFKQHLAELVATTSEHFPQLFVSQEW